MIETIAKQSTVKSSVFSINEINMQIETDELNELNENFITTERSGSIQTRNSELSKKLAEPVEKSRKRQMTQRL